MYLTHIRNFIVAVCGFLCSIQVCLGLDDHLLYASKNTQLGGSFFQASQWKKLKGYSVWVYKNAHYVTENQDGSEEVHIWTYWNDAKSMTQDIKSTKALIDLDCKERMVGTSNVTGYSEANLQGKQFESLPDMDMKAIEPDTFYFVLFNKHCNRWWEIWK
jgi:hypothetical protein